MKNIYQNIILIIEFIVLFLGVPIFLFFDKNIIHPIIILLPVLIALIFYFKTQKDFHIRDLIKLNISKRMWIKQAIAVILTGIMLHGYVLIFEPENLFNLPKGNPTIWIGMLFFYPIFSAYGQELIFRKFLFMRYKPLFMKKWIMVIASGVTFSFVHIVYFSPLSLILTFFAGIYLALIYHKSKSVLFVTIIHGVIGWLTFTVGLGLHFWVDMMKWL